MGFPAKSLIDSYVAASEPNFLMFLTSMVAKLRWDESSQMPLPRVSLIVCFLPTDE